MVLNRNKTLFDRDEKGSLIPKEVELVIDETDDLQKQFVGETIFIIPMSRGEIKKMFSEVSILSKSGDTKSERDLDAEIVIKYCIEPKYTEEDVKYMKNSYVSMIVNTILEFSGVVGNKKDKKKAIEETESDFSKN